MQETKKPLTPDEMRELIKSRRPGLETPEARAARQEDIMQFLTDCPPPKLNFYQRIRRFFRTLIRNLVKEV